MPTKSGQLVRLEIDGREVEAVAGTTVAAALQQHGLLAWRRSPQGELRGAFCGMGICFECRLEIDGIAGVRSCLTPVAPGMKVRSTPGASTGDLP